MRSSAAIKYEYDYNADDNLIEESVDLGEDLQPELIKKIAEEAENACRISGNINGSDLGDFERRYLLCCFA